MTDTVAAADAFTRSWSTAAAITMEAVLRELPTDPTEDGAGAWFITAQGSRLTARTMVTVRADLLHGWGVPLSSAALVFAAMDRLAVAASRDLLAEVLAAVRAGEDAAVAYAAALPPATDTVRAAAEAALNVA